eukprot:TRINITY_DN578_c0_g2_i1.p1 TRINITY_DN578_c0_g2~~TRINITY_DN578_c0_g2_i1.p1  ORF type:complete len:482 (+),score=95.93 TRINITY_DN578_c0_g2_i1:84-1529(+)
MELWDIAADYEVTLVKKAFRKWDRDQKGFINRGDLAAILAEITPSTISNKSIDALLEQCMAEADTNRDGMIEYKEFVEWITLPATNFCVLAGDVRFFDLETILKPLFMVYDIDNSGSISKAEFVECQTLLQNALKLSTSAAQLPHSPLHDDIVADKLFAEADTNSDRSISFAEFVDWQRAGLNRNGLDAKQLQELIPALARQLMRVFKFNEFAARMDEVDDAKNAKVLQRIIDNLAKFASDVWNTVEAGRERSSQTRTHYTNRWTKPPAGLSMRKLKARHLALQMRQNSRTEAADISVLCLPGLVSDHESSTIDSTVSSRRPWIAQVQHTNLHKSGKRDPQEPAYYEFRNLEWTPAEADSFTAVLNETPPELRLVCLLKSEAQFATKMSWNEVQTALDKAVALGFLTSEQHDDFTDEIKKRALNSLIDDDEIAGLSMAEKQKEILKNLYKKITLTAQIVMATLSELEIFRVSSAWADFMNE